MSNQPVVALVFQRKAPASYRAEVVPVAKGAACNILDTDREDARVVQLTVDGQEAQPGAITKASF